MTSLGDDAATMASALAARHAKAMRRVADVTKSLVNLAPTEPRLATMTVCCRMEGVDKTQPLDVTGVAELVQRGGAGAWRMGAGSFRNSLLLTLDKPGAPAHRFGIKLFANGAVHITGLQAFEQLAAVTVAIEELLGSATGCAHSGRLGGFSLQLANSNFKLGRRLNLPMVNAVLARRCDMFSRGISARYPALVVKVPVADNATVSVHLFRTGSVLISGVKQPEHAAEAFERVVAVLDEHVDFVTLA